MGAAGSSWTRLPSAEVMSSFAVPMGTFAHESAHDSSISTMGLWRRWPLHRTIFHVTTTAAGAPCAKGRATSCIRRSWSIKKPMAPPEDEDFLHPAAASVMKGVRRSELVPFLRRMAEEGLWERSTAYHRLPPAAREMLLFGCWTRPGHGTFLKSPKDDPSEVGAWLRWDGLFHALSGQLDRSTNIPWKAAIEGSRSVSYVPGARVLAWPRRRG